jgi:hypothetical protein
VPILSQRGWNTYVSVAFYSTQGYAAHVEFGAAKASLVRLTE